MDNLNFLRRVALYVGSAGLLVAALMTFKFGASMSFLHAVGLCLLTIAGSVIWPVIKHTWNAKSFQTWAMVACGVMFLGVEYFSHLGYTTSVRVGETQQTNVHNAKFDDARESLKSDRQNIDLWKKQLADLTAQAPWAATVKADAMRGELEAMEKAIELETARGGCRSKCQKLMVKKGELETRIGTVETANDLNKRIEATQRIIDQKTEKAAAATFESSAVVNQVSFVSQIWTGELTPDDMSMTWTQIVIGAFIAFVTTFLAPIMLNIAFGPEAPRDRPAPRAMTEHHAKIKDVMDGFKPVAQTPADPSRTIIINRDDTKVMDILEAAIRGIPNRMNPVGAA